MTIIDRDPFMVPPRALEPAAPEARVKLADPELYAKGMEDTNAFVLAALALSVKQGYLDNKRAHQLRNLPPAEDGTKSH